MSRENLYFMYHLAMNAMGDCDPAYPALDYLADRFEYNMEQRYWLAFLYQSCYCAPTAYYMISEFPDFENVDERRLQEWWDANKNRLYFQKDRAKIKNMNQFVPMFQSYRDLIVGGTQDQFFLGKDYDRLYKECSKIKYVGRFSLFLFLESVHRLTGLPMEPTGLDLKNAPTCRDGLCLGLGLDSWVESTLDKQQYAFLHNKLTHMLTTLRTHYDPSVDFWNVETSLCAFRKLFKPTRYLGYYIDRQQEEITMMQTAVPEGVDWSVLWDFRKEFFYSGHLGELNGWTGVRNDKAGIPDVEEMSLITRLRKGHPKRVVFPNVGAVYGFDDYRLDNR